jgi:hypothetical protein
MPNTTLSPLQAAMSGTAYNPQDPYDSRIGNGALPQGISGTADRAYTRQTQGNELVSNNLTRLLQDPNSAYINEARLSGAEQSNEQGQFLSSMGAGAAQRAAIQAGLPIAQGDAAAYGASASENLQYLNQRQLADINSQNIAAQIGGENYRAELGDRGMTLRQRENLAFQGEQQGLDRSFNMARDYTNYQYDLGRLDRTTQNNIRDYAARTGIDQRTQRTQFLNAVAQHALDDPDIWSPEVVAGVLNTFYPVYDDSSNDFDSWLNDMFGG